MDSLENIPGIGPKTIDKLKRLDINTPLDLIYHFPRRYIDFRNTINISQVEENQNITIHGQISFIRNIYTRNHKNIQIATIRDQTGQINLMWFNQPFLLHSLKKGQSLSFAGTVSRYKKHLTIMNPIFGQYHTGKIIAIYPETQGLTSKWFRKTIQQNITSFTKNISDPLPPSIIKKYQLTKLPIALHQIHQPKNPQILTSCQIRLKLAEILSLQAQSQLQKLQWSKFSPRFTLTYSKKTSQAIKKLISSLPWQLTNSQKKVWQEIKTDLLSSNTPTNRLLQGDVGSGKTIVALLSCYLAHLNLTTSLLLAPTEILAQQHYQTFKKILAKTKTPIKLLTAASKLKTDKIPLNSINITTHAAI